MENEKVELNQAVPWNWFHGSTQSQYQAKTILPSLHLFIFLCHMLTIWYDWLQSTGSFFHDKSITLGSLIGVSSIVELSRRSLRVRRRPQAIETKKNSKSKTWCLSLCPKDSTDAETANHNSASLGHFLAVERRVANEHRRSHSPLIYGPDELALAQPDDREPNSLFVDGRVAPPQSSPLSGLDGERRESRGLDQGYGCGVPFVFPCICG